MRKIDWSVLIILLFVWLTGIVLLAYLAAIPVRAHDWYDSDCCSDRDCKAVEDGHVVERGDSVHIKSWGVLPRNDPRVRRSRDDMDHVCQSPEKLYCVYLRPKGV